MERLDKLICERACVTRKEARALIKAGEVLVAGKRVFDNGRKVEDGEAVEVSGRLLEAGEFVYYMMNKPAGVLTATEDRSCKTVMDLLPQEFRRRGLFPAGRLDKDTEGFVLITNDGAFAHHILSPKNQVPKTYFVRLDRELPDALAEAFAAGVTLGNGDACSPAQLTVLLPGPVPEVRLVIYEGMYHQVKRMFKAFGLTVTYLKRVAIGGLALDENLVTGETRRILHKEIQMIAPSFGSLL